MSYAQTWGKYIGAYWAKVSLLTLTLLAGIGLQLLAPQIVRTFIDAASGGAALATLSHSAMIYLAVAISNQLLSAFSTYLSADVGWRATNALRLDLFKHILMLDMSFHKDRTPGEFIERIDGDVTHISNFFSQFVVKVTGSLILVAGILVLLWREDWRIGTLITIYVALVSGVLHRRRAVAVPATQMEREQNARVFGFIEERLAGLDDIRANGAGRYAMHRFHKLQSDWYQQSMKAWNLRVTIWVSMMLMSIAGNILVLALGVGFFQAGLITLGTVYLFYNYMTMLEGPLDEISRQMQELQRAGAGFKRVRELMGEQSRITDGAVKSLSRTAHAVEFDNVSFAYAEQGVLDGISFHLKPGETLGLLGRTGGGKTTLIRLLFRFYDPGSGRILLDGGDLRALTMEALRQRVGMVPQDIQLFEGSVRENLTFFDPSVPDEQLIETLTDLGLGEWLNSATAGLNTQLKAGGSGLSAGESQLLSFARVFLQNPGLVILDEPSSRLDPATEQLVTKAINRLLEGRTGIVIAHRLETVERLDKIMVLSAGRVMEFGNRTDLAADPHSTYHAMLQTSANIGLDERLERIGV